MTFRTGIFATALVAAVAATTAAQAHTGPGAGSGLAHGFLHPLGGADHVLALIAVGLLAAFLGGRALWRVPAAFLAMTGLGGIAAIGGLGLPAVETGIALSVVAIGALVAFGRRMPLAAAMAVVGAFAVFHGQAHGAEMPATASGVAYAAGFLLASAMLHGAGILSGLGLARLGDVAGVRLLRTGGAVTAAAGIAILGGAV